MSIQGLSHFAVYDLLSRDFLNRVSDGKINITDEDFPSFLYENETAYDEENEDFGLFRGFLLVRVFRHIFTGPTSAMEPKTKVNKSKAKKFSLTKVTGRMIAYASVQTYTALSSMNQWGSTDKLFNLNEFYNTIVAMFEKDADDPWVVDTLDWWNDQVPGLRPIGSRRKKRPGSNIQERTRVNPVDRVLAQRLRRAEANNGTKQPRRAEVNENELPRRAEVNRNEQLRHVEANGYDQPRHAKANGNELPRRTEANRNEQPCHVEADGYDQPHRVEADEQQQRLEANGNLQLENGHHRPRHISAQPRPEQAVDDVQRVGGEPEDDDEREEREEQARRRHAEKCELSRQQGLSHSLPPRRPSLTVKTNMPQRDLGEPSSRGKRSRHDEESDLTDLEPENAGKSKRGKSAASTATAKKTRRASARKK